MRRTAVTAAVVFGLVLAAPAASTVGAIAVGPEAAHAQKQGGGQVSRAGENAADLITDIVGPFLIVMIGVTAVGAFVQRNTGLAITATLVGLVAGLFIFAPDAAENAYRDIYRLIF